MKHTSKAISRRRFIGQMSCAGVGATSMLSSLLTLRLTAGAAGAVTQPTGDYKALVCLFLAGGNDSFNMLAPRQIDAYNDYATTREIIALPRTDLLPISSDGQPFSEFGLHPRLTRLQSLYNGGKAAFLANVGTMIAPMSVAEYRTNQDLIPRGLFSHSDQQFHWQTVVPQLRGGRPSGWGARVAELLDHLNAQGQISMNVSLSGLNIFQNGVNSNTFSASPAGAPDIRAYEDPVEKLAIDSLMAEQYKNLYQQGYAERVRNGIDQTETFASALEGAQLSTVFPNSPTGNNLRMIANIIAARGPLAMNRQIFYLLRGGWDAHTKVLSSQDTLFTEIDAAVGAFWDALVEIGVENQVTLFTASDFARTLSTNGQGSDHAWGGNHFMVGGAVQGGRVYGEYPPILIDSAVDVGRGRLLPSTSVDLYAAELASWFGVAPSDLELVLPNLRNFINPISNPCPIGFMS